MTLDAAQIDLSKAFVSGMGYVALSRVRSLDGIKLLGINSRALSVNPNVIEADRVFRKSSARAVSELISLRPVELRKLQEEYLKKITTVSQKVNT